MIKIIFFAKYREQAACEGLEIPGVGQGTTVAELILQLRARHPRESSFLEERKALVAVNQQMAGPSSPVRDGDTVAFFPPVTGG